MAHEIMELLLATLGLLTIRTGARGGKSRRRCSPPSCRVKNRADVLRGSGACLAHAAHVGTRELELCCSGACRSRRPNTANMQILCPSLLRSHVHLGGNPYHSTYIGGLSLYAATNEIQICLHVPTMMSFIGLAVRL